MQISYVSAIQHLQGEINTLKEVLVNMAAARMSVQDRTMQAKMFSIGDTRPLLHFLSDSTVRLNDVKLIGKPSSSKDFGVCLLYEIDSRKTSTNKFHRFGAASHATEQSINSLLGRPGDKNIFIEPFATANDHWFVLFWEEAEVVAQVDHVEHSVPAAIERDDHQHVKLEDLDYNDKDF